MKLHNFDEFVEKYSTQAFMDILDSIEQNNKLHNINDVIGRITEINMIMNIEYLRSYHEWLSKFLEDK